MPRVTDVRYVGRRQTYDLEVDHPSHQFYLANGLLTSNSHAVSYALDSYMCAYLLHHFEPEWLCAYAEEYIDSNDKKRAKVLSEIRALGYRLVRVDINHADKTWTIIEGKKFMPAFTSVKSVGDKAVDEILANRPYRSPRDLLWDDEGRWRHSKFNKSAMKNLIKVGAFGSMDIVGEGRFFSHYRHMYECIIEHWAELKKKSGWERLQELADEYRDMPDWTREERAEMYMSLVGALDLDLIFPDDLVDKLARRGVSSVDDALEGEKAIHWLVTTDVRPAKTKRGKDYLRVQCVGEGGQQHRMFVWGWKPGREQVRKYCGYLAEVEKSSFGLSTVPWKMREVSEQ